MGSFSQPQWQAWAYPGVADAYTPYTQLPDYPTYLADSMDAYHSHHTHLVHHHQMTRTTESKPRLSKEEVEILETEFQKNHKPNSSTKKALAESMRVDHARINNWFQNRRAREKKENNIREYEARQRLEKEKSDTETGRQESDRKRDLVASSAPFPEPRQPSLAKEQSPDAPSELSTPESASDLNDAPSPPMAARRTSEHSLAFSHTEEEQFCITEDGEIKSEEFPEDVQDYFCMSDAGIDLSSNGIPLVNSEMILPIQEKEPENFWRNYPVLNFHPAQYQTTDYVDQAVSRTSPSKQLKSPAPMDIASRRNRRPAPLTINGSRSYSGAPRTSTEIPKRSEQGSSMRRVASANGPVRVAKPAGTPRSPFSQRNRSPVTAGSVAPPTPNTPVVVNPQRMSRNVLISKYSSSALFQDPTLKTPPATPGIMDNLFHAGSAYDDGFTNSNMGSFSSDFELPGVAAGASGYMASAKGCSSQPVTPLFAPQIMTPGYGNFYGRNGEYYWSDASTSGRSSPSGLNAQLVNMQHSVFGQVEN